MIEKRNIVSVIFFIIWAGLLAALMIRLPVADMFSGLELLTADIVLSAVFCVTGILAAVAGLFLSSKALVLLSAFSGAMQIFSVLCFILYVMFFNRSVLAFALYFANPFCAVLCTPGFAVLAAYVVLSALLPLIAFVLLHRKERVSKKKTEALQACENAEK